MVCLVGPHGDPLELFEFTKKVLDKVTPFVNFGVNKQRLCAARVLRDDNICASFMQVSNDAVAVECLVGDQTVEIDAIE